jgi:prevent-host-death family protein
MMESWSLQDATSRLGELVKRAGREGPQEICVHGRPAVVVVSHADYVRLTSPPERLVDFLAASPLKGLDLGLERDRSTERDAEL